MEKRQLKRRVKALLLLVMLWVLPGLLLRLGRLSTLRVFLNLQPSSKLVPKLQLLNLRVKIPSNLCMEFFNLGCPSYYHELLLWLFISHFFFLYRKKQGNINAWFVVVVDFILPVFTEWMGFGSSHFFYNLEKDSYPVRTHHDLSWDPLVLLKKRKSFFKTISRYWRAW